MSDWGKWRVSRAGGGWSRRAVLGGAAAAITLPWLPSLLPRHARADGAAPVRLLFWFCPNGMNMADFRPTTLGAGWTPGPILTPISDLVDEVHVLSGLHNPAVYGSTTAPHPTGTATWLSAGRVSTDEVRAETTVDQVAAATLGQTSRFPSLQLKLDDSRGQCDPGYPCAYTESVSWASPTTPLAPLSQPSAIFDRLFTGISPGLSEADRARRAATQGSVLDAVTREADALRGKLSSVDGARLEEYLTGVRELERRVNAAGGEQCAAGQRPEDLSVFDVQASMDAMIDLMVTALQCDLTRFISFMTANGQSNRDHGFIGVPGPHHITSHHLGDPVQLAKLTQIDTWEVAMYGELLRRLRDTPEGAGSLLDSCAVMLGSEVSDGNAHSGEDMPVLLAGRAGGALPAGRHLQFSGDSLGRLYVSLLSAAGVGVGSFGIGGDRPLPGLLVT